MSENTDRRIHSVILFTLACLLTLGTGVRVDGSSPAEHDLIRVALDSNQARRLRVELFDAASGEPLLDTGVRDTTALELDLGSLDRPTSASPMTLEVRAWNDAGDLVLSQVASLGADRGAEIVAIRFESIPAGTTMVSDPIVLASDAEVAGGLAVAGAVRTAELRGTTGGSFFDACAPGSSIRSIEPNGTVSCEPDDAGDNLGNHTAQQDLQMGTNTVVLGNGTGLRAAGGAQIRTGDGGLTFQLLSGGPTGDIARSKDATDGLKLAIDPNGHLAFASGQKVCTVVKDDVRTAVLASAGWTADTCSAFRNAVQAAGDYQLLCIFETHFSFGALNGGIPPQNCGW